MWHWGLEFLEAFLMETVDLLAFFPLGSGAQMGERVRAIDLDPMDGSPPLLPNPLHDFLLPLDLPHAARIETRRSKLNWRGREDQGDVLPHLFLQFFLGKP
jgi:hypothetical protein